MDAAACLTRPSMLALMVGGGPSINLNTSSIVSLIPPRFTLYLLARASGVCGALFFAFCLSKAQPVRFAVCFAQACRWRCSAPGPGCCPRRSAAAAVAVPAAVAAGAMWQCHSTPPCRPRRRTSLALCVQFWARIDFLGRLTVSETENHASQIKIGVRDLQNTVFSAPHSTEDAYFPGPRNTKSLTRNQPWDAGTIAGVAGGVMAGRACDWAPLRQRLKSVMLVLVRSPPLLQEVQALFVQQPPLLSAAEPPLVSSANTPDTLPLACSANTQAFTARCVFSF